MAYYFPNNPEDDPMGGMTNYKPNTGNYAKPEGSGTPTAAPQANTSGGGGAWYTDPSLWNTVLGGVSNYLNRPKDGKFVQTPLPPEVREIFNTYMQLWKKQPALQAMAPMIGGAMKAIGTPSFQMTGLIEGPGIPKGLDGQNWVYKTNANKDAFNIDELYKNFMEVSLGKGSGGNFMGPQASGQKYGPKGNPIGARGSAGGSGVGFVGGRQKDQGDWHDFNMTTGNATGFDRANDGVGGRDPFGMAIEDWKKTALKNPNMAAAYRRYDQWLTGLPRDEYMAEMEKQKRIEDTVKAIGKDAIKDFVLQGGWMNPIGWVGAKAASLGFSFLKDKAGGYVLDKVPNTPEGNKWAQGFKAVLNNLGVLVQIGRAI